VGKSLEQFLPTIHIKMKYPNRLPSEAQHSFRALTFDERYQLPDNCLRPPLKGIVLPDALAACLFLFFFLYANASLSQTMGYTEVNATIGENGNAVVKIPINIPQGTILQPSLNLTYSSHGMDGAAGLGWNLDGVFQTITRVPATVAQDGFFDPVDFDDLDKFALNGERLMLVSGVYGQNDAEYRTEQNSFAKIISYGSTGFGPEGFKVWTKDGLTLNFGFHENWRVEASGTTNKTIAWLIADTYDTNGNFMAYSYQESNSTGEYWPKAIYYTGRYAFDANGAATVVRDAYNTILFDYETRTDVAIKYMVGHQSSFSKRLSSITLLDNSKAYRRYKLEYMSSGTFDISRLSKVTEYGTDNTTSLRSVEINWASISFNGYSGTPSSWSGYDNPRYARDYRTGDFNGDGFADIITFLGGELSQWLIGLSNGKNFENSFWVGHNAGMANTILGDFNGDGKTDLAGYVGNGQNENWQICLSNGFGFSCNVWAAHKLGAGNTIGADFNGDGRTDLAVRTSGRTWEIYLSSGSSFQKVIWAGTDALIENIQVADFNGDGRADLAGYKNGQWEICLSDTSGFVNSIWNGINPYNNNLINNVKIGDFNGDGLSDLMVFKGRDEADISFSTGVNFTNVKWPLANESFDDEDAWYIGDFNGDGKADWAQEKEGNNFFISNGKSFQRLNFAGSNGSNPFALPLQAKGLKLADFNGDGITDFAQNVGSAWVMYLSTSPKHFVASVKNGNGVTQSFTYKALTDKEVYTNGSNSEYPLANFSDPLYVVNKYSVDDGIGGTKSINAKYENIQYDQSGRGLRGFAKITQTDASANSVVVTYYNRDHRYVGANIQKIEQSTFDGKLLKVIENDPEIKSYSGNVYFSFYSKTTEKSFELDGSEISFKATDIEYDTFGNATKIVESWGNNYTITTTNAYDNNTLKWHLGRLKEAIVKKQLQDKPSITKNSTFQYDVNGNLIRETLLPDHETKELKTEYTLDENGNRVIVTQSGPGITSRSDFNTYDNLGRNIVETKNSLGHTQSFTYSNNLLASSTDPNGRVINVTRDAFGRETRSDNPDGTWETTSYSYCGGSVCPSKAIYYVETEESGKGKSRVYYDMLDRKIREEATGYNGTKVNVDYVYSADGTIRSISDPYYNGYASQQTLKEYDEVKRLSKETAPGDRVTIYQYHGLSNTVINPEGQKTIQTHNPQGKLMLSVNNQNQSTSYQYDSDLNQIEVTNATGDLTSISYDIRGFKISQTEKNVGGTYLYNYNTLGLLTSQTDPKGQTTTNNYDILNRLTSRSEKEGVTEWKYDALNSVGQVYQILFGGIITDSYLYDSKGRIIEVNSVRNGSDKVFKYGYEANTGLLQTITYPNNFTAKHVYTNGFLMKVVDNTTNAEFWRADIYDAEGRTTQFNLGNGLQTIRDYQKLTGYLASIQTGKTTAPTSVQNLQFTFSSLGNLTERRDLAQSLTETLQYDDLNRLIQSQVTGQLPLTVTYDVLGNITYKSDVGTYRYNEGGIGSQILTSIDHSTVEKCVYEFKYQTTYTSYNYVSSISNASTKVSISYGPARERIGLILQKNGFQLMNKTYVGGLYEETKDTGGKITTVCFIKAGDDILGYRIDDGTTVKITYVHTDHLGSVTSLSNETGAVIERYSYDPWGKLRNPNNWKNLEIPPSIPISQRGFTFHEMLDIDWLICMNARVYNPVLGRFLSPDPFVQFPEDLQGLNRFSYVHNNPLSFTDPSGFFLKGLGRLLKKNLGTIVGIGIAIGTYGVGSPWLAIGSGAAAGFGSSFTNALVSGEGLGGAFKLGLQGGLWGGVNGGITYGIGTNFDPKGLGGGDLVGMYAKKAVVHGISQGALSEAQGGDFKSGFLGGATSSFGLDMAGGNIVSAAIVGGTAAELSGGKFANGAFSAAFVATYNHASHEKVDIEEIMRQDCSNCFDYPPYGFIVKGTIQWYNGAYLASIGSMSLGVSLGIFSIRGMPATPSRITATSLKEFKTLIRELSKNNNTINRSELKQLQKLSSRFGGSVRQDLNPVKGNRPAHVQVEELGQRVEARKILLEK
jgi:RHS repeat-associated protein